MYQLFFAERDTTLFEKYPEQNTGIDQILELTKIASSSRLGGFIQANTYNSRILIDFGQQITSLSSSVASGLIPPIGNNTNSASIYLNLRASDASDLKTAYTIKAYPVSESWVNGNGNLNDVPRQTNGTSWYYTDDKEIASGWNTASAHSKGLTSLTETKGGGTWITGSGFEASQSFSFEAPDIRINVTDIVSKWIDGTVTNNGFIIKRPHADEISGDIFGSLKFFGRESHTIFLPRLEVAWDDTDLSGTGSFTEINSNTYVPYFKNIRPEYHEAGKAVFRIGVRPEFPSKAYQTSSFFLTDNRLPTSSYYSIKDAVTDETIIPFDTTATKISCDTVGSFFKLRLNTFMPERYYKIQLKIERDGGDDVQIHDDRFYFKVVR